jgi:L-rhamnose mutarotase
MLEVLKKAKIQNYTIWNSGSDLFGYYEVPDINYSNSVLAGSQVVKEWNQLMESIYNPDIDPETGTVREMQLMFKFNLTK